MNAFYGAVASPKSRFYNKHIGEAITSFARHIIKQTKAYSEHQGHKVVYGDTDSVFLQPKEDLSSFKEKEKRGKDLERELNEYFKNWVEEQYAVTCKLQLELEKLFSHFFIASKKRYVGYDELSEDTIFVGMEAIRGDWTELAKEFQRQLVSRMFADMNKTEVAEFIREYVRKLEEGKFDDYLVYHKKITKPLSHYVKTTPPHVKAARELEHFNGRTVSYVMTKEGPRHVSLLEEEVPFDYQHYIEKQLKGVSDDLLESFGIDFDEVVSKRKQKGLDQFFG
jgi:DNA polymerase-2